MKSNQYVKTAAIMLAAWTAGAGCTASPDPGPSSSEAVDPVIVSPCDSAANGVYCGDSTPVPTS
jgi:hypothetical protein